MPFNYPGNKDLVRANGVVAPQYFDERTGEWEYIQGDGGAMYYVDRDKSKQFYRKSSESFPTNAKTGDVTLYVDSGDIYVFYGKEWWLI